MTAMFVLEIEVKVKEVHGPEHNAVFFWFSFFHSFSIFYDIIIGVFRIL